MLFYCPVLESNRNKNRFPTEIHRPLITDGVSYWNYSRDEKEPLKEEKKITPIIDSGLRRETSITFDGKRSVSKTGFVGKDSAV